ncbi:phosphocholine-specific phospholipase C [Siphonobacter sp. SORGH_AS_0500]|uniref:phosphocholine-specific phospholipase C n=1 Tax=Siphonobacter sp. SORGH_AS_0500 TaxID=1864824 RepID=UPI0028654B72|nr:phospholipase C, phosphocholine-specific [Siphonobacter sp. SORGH_AS_0500]MDR6197405.1 phospholipase C [Siphonobacter sp. SORGH_AS_0500]
MMDSRRDFLKKASLLAAAGLIPASIQKALAIDPEEGTSYLDAEHIVILMQENRSFDHALGSLRGVRGFNDPRAIDLPNKRPVWLQTNDKGETYAPFRLNLKDTKATWMNSLPHSWGDQVEAFNGGKYNKWLQAKKSGNQAFASMPLTLGYYTREDLPFYYALADAFTVCDHNFCSSQTGTTPNRLFLWTGTIRDPRHPESRANVWNSNVDYGKEASWKTFPERLEDEQISWKIYQNEISLPSGLEGEAESWLANFTDNPIEWFSQFQVRFHPAYHAYLTKFIEEAPQKITDLEKKLQQETAGSEAHKRTKQELTRLNEWLKIAKQDHAKWTPEAFDKLSEREKNLHRKAFTTNVNDPDYRKVTKLTYDDKGTQRETMLPKGDILHQFRSDVENKTLPTVSWLVAPENFSDHPTAPWYGAWYISEAMDILTKNPDVWKKTIFILAYDENDGYFDHLPPFVPAHPTRPETGKTSKGIDTTLEFVSLEQEAKEKNPRSGPIGLGYRVPLVIASPWSRGGFVCSEVFDHTSVLQFLENFLSHKKGKSIRETNISDWRRTICGDLTSVFRPFHGEKMDLPQPVNKNAFIEQIHSAQFKGLPSNFHAFSETEIQQLLKDPKSSIYYPRQEKGTRPANALPYELYADAQVNGNDFVLTLKSLGPAGSPFTVYEILENDFNIRHYTVAAGDVLTDHWPISGNYYFRVYGPNGFYREFKGAAGVANLQVHCAYEQSAKKEFTGNLLVTFSGKDGQIATITDHSYGQAPQTKKLSNKPQKLTLNQQKSHHWYDFSVAIQGVSYRYAGHIETGKSSFSDPAMS